MQWIIPNMRWIMVVSGAMTATMIYAAVPAGGARRAQRLDRTFGADGGVTTP